MKHYMYALSRSERGWLVFSIAFLVAAFIYGLLAQIVVSAMPRPETAVYLRDCPVLLLISVSTGLFFTTAGHYAIRQFRLPDNRGIVLHD